MAENSLMRALLKQKNFAGFSLRGKYFLQILFSSSLKLIKISMLLAENFLLGFHGGKYFLRILFSLSLKPSKISMLKKLFDTYFFWVPLFGILEKILLLAKKFCWVFIEGKIFSSDFIFFLLGAH